MARRSAASCGEIAVWDVMLSPFVAQLAERDRVDSESADDNSADFRIGELLIAGLGLPRLISRRTRCQRHRAAVREPPPPVGCRRVDHIGNAAPQRALPSVVPTPSTTAASSFP